MEDLNGENESIYIKCLFKTIIFEDLKQQLLRRGQNVSNDSYYVMSLKLRLDILQKSNCTSDVKRELEAELDTMRKKSLGYICSLVGCKFRTKNYDSLLHHLKILHTGTNQKLICQLHGCKRELSRAQSL